MDRIALRDAVYRLEQLASANKSRAFAYEQGVQQFNYLLEHAKSLYPNRVDIQAIRLYQNPSSVQSHEFTNAVLRLKSALDLRPASSAGELLSQVQLPPDAPADVRLDMRELEGAISLELTKAALLLAGSIAEALLISRHTDISNRGPGLSRLVQQAREQRLFGKDTLRNLETLVDYRDLIHPRAEKRNQTFRNQARVDAAVTAIKLLCVELEDISVRFV